ncbi:MAG: hypothetical protein ACK5PB_23540 [Pirellula sp.]|jgi:hypothetical protein
MLTSTPAVKYKVIRPDTWGWLKLGVRKHLIEIVEVSSVAFTARISQSLAKRIRIGKKFRIYHQGMLWAVQAKQKWLHESKDCDVEFELLTELFAPKVNTTARQKSLMSTAGTSSNLTLVTTFLGVTILTVLLMPSWGGKWGTAQFINNSVNTVFQAFKSLVTGR